MKYKFSMDIQAGGHKSRIFSSEVCRNMYLGFSETNGKKGAHDFPGLKKLSDGTGKDRGSHVMAGERYLINGTDLIKEDSNFSRTIIGEVPGEERAIFADDGLNLYFVTENIIYRFFNGGLTTVSQDAIDNPKSIAYLNRQFIITGTFEGFNDGFAVSNVGDGTTYDSLNTATEESNPDTLLRVYVFNHYAYMFGTNSVAPWYNSGIGNPPFDRQQTALVSVGLAGKFAVTSTDNFLYWLSDDKKIYKCVGSSAKAINTSGISYQLEAFNVVDDCIASSFTYQGMDFVLFKFPTEMAAFVYNETLGYWFELDSGTSINSRTSWLGDEVTQCYGKNLVTDYFSGHTYELDPETYTDNGLTRLRVLTFPTISGDKVGFDGQRITATQVRINCQTGVGLVDGQGFDPVLMCQFSQEGGEVWKGERHVKIGRKGDYVKNVDFWDFATGYNIRLRIMISDPVFFSAFDGYVNIENAGF